MTEPEAKPVRVMLVDDHPLWRDGVRADLEAAGVAEVVAEAADGGEAIEAARESMPEVIVMDLNLPTVSGVEATRRIVEESPHVRVLVLSASAEEADVLEAVKAGAAGYLLKSSTGAEIADAVRRVRDGEPVFTPSLAGLVLEEFRRVASGGAESEPQRAPPDPARERGPGARGEGLRVPRDRGEALRLGEDRAEPRAEHPHEAAAPPPRTS